MFFIQLSIIAISLFAIYKLSKNLVKSFKEKKELDKLFINN